MPAQTEQRGIHCRRASKAYGANRVLEDFSLHVGPQEIVCLLGPSGCGKTTLLHMLAGLIAPDSGRVLRPAGRPGIVFQEPRLLPWRTAAQNLSLGLRAEHTPPELCERVTLEYLARLGLKEAAALYPHQLSGGMRQRVALGRALAIDPPCLLLDEPFKSLDVGLRLGLLRLLLDEWQRRPRPIVFVTHDTAEAALTGQRILVLGGRPLCVRAELSPASSPLLRQPGDAEVLRTEAELYALLSEELGRTRGNS